MQHWLQRRFDDIAVVDRGAPPRRLDWVVVTLLAAAGFAELLLDNWTWPIASTATMLVALLVLPFRRQIPLHAALIAFFAQFILEMVAATQDVVADTTLGHGIAGLMLVYAMCRWLVPQRALVGLGLTMVLVSVPEFIAGGVTLENILIVIPWVILALIALAMRYRARLAEERATSIRLAERNALARELHDTVAHHVSAIAVQAQAARFVAASDPQAAVANIEHIEQIANTTIDDMRRMVGILRSDDDHARTVVAADFNALNEAGVAPPVSVTGETSLEHLPTAVAGAVYRIAQESVTNARRHSRGITFIDLELVTRPTHVTLEIRNDGSPSTRSSGGGYGLIGMQERAESLGGTMTSGPRPASGWSVRATIPLARTA